MHAAGLAAKLKHRRLIFDLLLSGVQIARSSRCQSDSRLLPRLEKAHGPHPEGEEEDDAPEAINTSKKEYPSEPDTDGQHCDAHHQSLPTLSGADIHHAHNVSN